LAEGLHASLVFEAINKRTLGVGGAALLEAVVFTVVLWAFRPAAL
jgi:hypothetical protein